MNWLRDLTIKNKLTVIMMITSMGAVLLACVIFINSSFILHKKEHLQKNIVLANITGNNCQAALMFDVPEDAEKMLSTLSADKSIVFACVYTPDGKVFAQYHKSDKYADITPPEMRDPGYSYEGRYMSLFHTIRLNDKIFGSIYLMDNEQEVYTSLKWDIVTLVLVLSVALTTAYIIAFSLQAIISKPILSLAETAAAVTKTEDYSIRGEKYGEDEVGTLIDSFNLMLSEIQQRESALSESESRFRSIVETSSDWIWEVDANCIYTYSSPKIEDLLGYTPEEVVGKKPFDLMPSEGVDRILSKFAEICEAKMPFVSFENINLHKDGRQVVLERSAVPILDEHGNMLGYRGIDRDITERKRTEEKIEYLAKFPAENPNPVLRIGRDGVLLFANDASRSLLDEWNCDVGEPVPEYWCRNVQEVLLAGSDKKIELEHASKVLSFVITPVPEADYVNLYGRDITELKRTEEELKESSVMLQMVMDNIPQFIFWKDRNSIYLGCNQNFARVAGYDTAEEIVGKTDYDMAWKKEEADFFRTCDERVMRSGKEEFHIIEPQLQADGTNAWLDTNKVPLRDSEGNVVGILGSYEDITVRKRAEEALASSESKFRSLAQTASSAIISADSNGDIIFWNPAAEKMFGFSEDEAIGSSLVMIMPDRYHEIHKKGLERVVTTGKTRISGKTIELYGLKKDGSEFPLELSLSKWNTPEGMFFTAILNDITIRKNDQTEREQLLRAVAAKNEELESIVYTASHDLRSPLVNIDGFSQELAYSCDDAVALFREVELPCELEKKLEDVLTEDIPTSLNFIRSSANKMDMLVKGLLKLSRLGRAVFEIKPLDMNKMFAHIQRTMQYQINESCAEVVIEEVPDCQGDAGQIHQVFTNIIDNALKYLDAEKKGLIRISGRCEDGRSIYSIQDNGVGIDPGHKERVFEIFHRLNLAGAIRGEGIGLTIVKRIIDRHGGKVWVDSEAGQGTTFHISLPSVT
ncbi:MAG: PAS domain S-box protein [Planctomycetes bacterium]|nr:PAS domain S-box protein [Planctomycetota bacterium]